MNLLNDNINLVAPKPLDARTMKTLGGIATVYASVSEANTAIIYRNRTLTIPILIGGIPIDHWYQNGLTDGDLVPKPAFSTSAVGFLKGVSGNITGQSLINDGDVSTIGWNKIASTPTSLSGYGILDAQTFIASGTTSQYFRGDKTFQTLNAASVGLANVDNVLDVNKPISTAVQTALNAKVSNTSPAFLGIPTAPTASLGTNTTQIATTAFVLANASSSGVASFNTRTGAISPQTNDYTFAQIASKPTSLAGYGIGDAVPTSRTITINSTVVDLSANRTFSVQSVLVSGTNIKTLDSNNILGSGDIPFPVVYYGPEFVGTGADSSHKVYIDAAQLSIGTIPLSRFGAASIPISAINATGGSSGRVLTYDGTWVANGSTNVQMTVDGPGFTITPPVAGGYNANVITLGTNATYGFVNELKSLQRLDILALSSEIWLRSNNVSIEADVVAIQNASGNATSIASQVGSYAHSMRNSLWNTGTTSAYLSYNGMRSYASTSIAGRTTFGFVIGSPNSDLSSGTMLFSINSIGVNDYADNSAAISAGLVSTNIYRTGDFLKIVH